MDSSYDFVEKPSEEFYCPVTFDLLREPHLTPCCGNHLSQEAVTRLQGQPCPVCKQPTLSTVPDKFFKRKVNELKLYCRNKSLGCEWVGELGSLDRHLSRNSVEGECQFVTVACPYDCGDSLQRRQLERHTMNECPNRSFTCQYCGHKSAYITMTNEHTSTCKKYPLQCPNQCGESAIERQNLPIHMEETCPLQVIKCEFSYAGCEVECQRQHMQTHLDENVRVHLTTVSRYQKYAIERCIYERQMDTLTSVLNQVSLALQKPIEPVFVPPPDMVMTDFEQHKKAKDRWFGPSFYSHIGGYKMCLSVDANGVGDGRDTHVTVSIYLMRGENDDQLKWPFRGDISIQLLNQRRHEDHCEKIVCFDDTAHGEIAGKVVGKDRASRSWGYSKFVAHADLSTQDKEYLKSDTLKFRISKCIVKSI